MSERSSYKPGTFSWADLATGDADAAQEFYGALHGWEFDPQDLPGGGVYVMARKGGRNVAAIAEDDRQPPHWNNYVTVASAEDTAARAQELGGTVVAPPFDVMDAGRMAVVQDPTGGILCVWEARANIGAERVNEPGAMTWNDLTTPDPEAASRFYGDLFGWRTELMDETSGYRVIFNGERSNGGMLPPPADGIPPNWMPYFGVDDAEQAIPRVKELGGQVLAGPQPVPTGKFIVIADPQGAISALWSGVYDD
ncbi:MAG: VOC family protein [Actinomycetota bacterium]|nr:VOC family protein [Actinomycetota bacterium]MDQ5809066.1 VOC family protein [Actinomycetota bacterium]